MENIYTISEVSGYLKMVPEVIRRYIRAGKLKAVKFGKEYRVKEVDLKEFIENCNNTCK